MGNPKVSVIIPVYNTEKYLKECLDSICGQTLTDMEIICVDDGSTDGSPEILKEYQERDGRITVLTQENQGASVARNNGLEHVSGEYLYFMDSDDILEPDALEALWNDCREKNLDVLYFDGVSFGDPSWTDGGSGGQEYYARQCDYSTVVTGKQLFEAMVRNQEYRVSPCLQFIRREYLEEQHLRFYSGIVYEDNIFTFACMCGAKRVRHIRKAFFRRRIRSASVSTRKRTFFHAYCQMKIYMEIEKMFRAGQWTEEEKLAVATILAGHMWQVRNLYRNLPDQEKAKLQDLSAYEQKMFEIYVKYYEDRIGNIEREKEKLRKEKEAAVQEKEKILSSDAYRLGTRKAGFLRLLHKVTKTGEKKD